MGLLDGKTALVTGGSRGIGKAIALRFAQEGADVAITCQSNEVLAREVVAEIEAMGRRALCFKADATDFELARQLVAQVVEQFGQLDILVNNAGITRDGLFMRMSEQNWDDVITTNLKSAFNYANAAVPVMMRRRSGSIINMSSVVGLKGNPGQVNYAASKAGLIGMTQALSKEIGSRGVRVNAIAPGIIKSDMTDALTDEQRNALVDTVSLKRMGTVEEVAGVALFLASDLSSYVTGEVINCSGNIKS